MYVHFKKNEFELKKLKDEFVSWFNFESFILITWLVGMPFLLPYCACCMCITQVDCTFCDVGALSVCIIAIEAASSGPLA